jgi:hypothetical protein
MDAILSNENVEIHCTFFACLFSMNTVLNYFLPIIVKLPNIEGGHCYHFLYNKNFYANYLAKISIPRKRISSANNANNIGLIEDPQLILKRSAEYNFIIKTLLKTLSALSVSFLLILIIPCFIDIRYKSINGFLAFHLMRV